MFDDDRTYPELWINQLIDGFIKYNGNATVARQGTLHKTLPFMYDKFNLTPADMPFTCVKTASGVIYPLKALPSTTQKAIDFADKYKEKASYRNDDMLLASWCYKSDTPLYILPVTEDQLKEWYSMNSDSLNDEVSLSRIPNHRKPQIELAHAMMMESDWPLPWPEVATASFIVFALLFLFFTVFFAFR